MIHSPFGEDEIAENKKKQQEACSSEPYFVKDGQKRAIMYGGREYTRAEDLKAQAIIVSAN